MLQCLYFLVWIQFLIILQHLRSPILILIAHIVSMLTDPFAWLLFFSILYWTWDKDKAAYYLFLLVSFSFLSGFLKILFHVSRPFSTNPQWLVSPREQDFLLHSYSFPSQRALISSAFYTIFILHDQPKRMIRILGGFLLFILVLGQPLLGVNYLEDMLVGLIIGSVIGFFVWYFNIEQLIQDFLESSPNINEQTMAADANDTNDANGDIGDYDDTIERTNMSAFFSRLNVLYTSLITGAFTKFFFPIFLFALLFSFAIFTFQPITTYVFTMPFGLFIGLTLGLYIENSFIMFPSKPFSKLEFIIRAITGVFSISVLYLFFQLLIYALYKTSISPMVAYLNFIQYIVIGLDITVIVPFLITKIELE